MAATDLSQALAQTLRHAYGDFLDLPLLRAAAPAAPGERTVEKAQPSQTLAAYAESIRFCQACSLHIGRRKLVFGRGHWGARIAFVGDVPSAADDAKGEPFSDESGALLHKMIVAMKIKPEETYLTNVFKCRPPAGQVPDSSHYLACEPHLNALFSQVQAPFVVALGEVAAKALSRSESPLRVLRRQVYTWNERKLICTHHPRDLLTSPEKKKEAWDDLQLVMREMGASG